MSAKRRPSYLLHKSTGQARCRINGKDIYLGRHGTPESRDRYEEVVAEWYSRQGNVDAVTLRVDDLAIQFIAWADGYYLQPDGSPTGEAASLRHAIRPVVAMFGRLRAREFGPLKLKAVQQSLVEAGHCRTNINRMVGRIKRMFRWGAEHELLPVESYSALATVSGLKKGRSQAVESESIQPVPEETVSATMPYLSPVLQAMVRLQLLTGARPGEICSMRPSDITIGTDGTWCYRPAQHKTAHHGKSRRIFVGPEGQAVLRPFLDRDPESYCFSPAESRAAFDAERRKGRQSPRTPSQSARRRKRKPQRAPRQRYSKDSYRKAIERAAERAFSMPAELRDIGRTVARMTGASERERAAERERLSAAASAWRSEFSWHPNQLRHTAGTLIRKQFGLEAARAILGHSNKDTTEIYAERDDTESAKIMREIG